MKCRCIGRTDCYRQRMFAKLTVHKLFFIPYDMHLCDAEHITLKEQKTFNLIGMKATVLRPVISTLCATNAYVSFNLLIRPFVASVILSYIIIYYIIRTKSCTRSFYTFFNAGAVENLFAALFTYAPRDAQHQSTSQAADTCTHTHTQVRRIEQ